MGRNVIAGFVAILMLLSLAHAYTNSITSLQNSTTSNLSEQATGQRRSGRKKLSAPVQIDIVKGLDGWLFPGWDYLVDERQRQTALAVLQVAKMTSEAKERGSRIIILLVPNKARVHADFLPPERLIWTRHHSSGFEQLADSLREKSLEVETAWPQFSPTDAHWTGESSEAVARQLSEKLGVLSVAGGVKSPLPRWIEEKRYGDLASLARSRGDLSSTEELFRRRDYVPPLLGEPVVEIIGNSFIDRYYGFPQELSRQLQVPVELYVRHSGPGPWQAMRDYLASGKSRPLIIWQIQETSFSSFQPDVVQN